MSDQEQQSLFEIVMAIGNGVDFRAMLQNSLSVIIRKLGCNLGAVVRRTDTAMEIVHSIPYHLKSSPEILSICQSSIEEPAASNQPFMLENSGQILMAFTMPGYGMMILGKVGPPFSRRVMGTLMRVADKLSASCIASEQAQIIRDMNLTLEQKVQERTRAMETANTDLTRTIQELKAAQAQLIHSEKMASLGQLVAGVAHELNNPVGFIYANFPQIEEYVNDLLALIDALLDLQMDESSRKLAEQRIRDIDLDFLREDILEIIRSGKSGASRIKEIVFSLRSFSRLDEAELKSVLLEDGLNDTLAILVHETRGRIKVIKDYQLNEPVICLAGQINQVFMNIIYNGIQAIRGEGTLTIATYKEHEWAIVTIQDSGEGIPQEVISKIFDPFFTTKKIGEGTGLGLSISYGIIEKHGGLIKVESEVGKGARFTIRLKLKSRIDGKSADL